MVSLMKILHICKYYPPDPGGIESFVQDLAEAQAGSGHRVRVLSHASNQVGPAAPEEVHRVLVTRIKTWGQLAYAPVSPSFGLCLFSCLRSFQPDVVHVHMPNTSAFWLLLRRQLPRVVVHWHADVAGSALNPKLKWLYRMYQPFEKRLLVRSHTIICTSKPYLDSSLSLRPFRDKCRIVPLGLNPDRFLLHPEADGPPLAEGGFFVLSVGRFAYYKGFEHLIRAATRLPEARFCIAGDGERYHQMQQLVRDLSLSDRIDLPGQVSHSRLVDLLRSCDLFCLPSVERTEAFGMVLLEAMCCGKPLITTAIPGSGVSVVNKPGLTGLQVPVNDPEALAQAIRTYIQHPEIRIKMGRQACERFHNNYHIQHTVKLIDDIYADRRGDPSYGDSG